MISLSNWMTSWRIRWVNAMSHLCSQILGVEMQLLQGIGQLLDQLPEGASLLMAAQLFLDVLIVVPFPRSFKMK